jgi:hypothetical protein
VELETVNGKFKFGLITTEFNEPVFLHGGALSHVFRANLSHAGSLNSGFLQARRRTLCLRRADLIRYNTMKDFVPLLFKPAEGTTGKGCSGVHLARRLFVARFVPSQQSFAMFRA